MIKLKPPAGWPATETIEEAVALLRRTPASTLLCSLIGGVPFWLTLLYFVADMSHDAYAQERLAGASLTLAVLYLWKKCWQSVYTAGLHSLLAGVEPPAWTARRIGRLILTQAETQFWGLIVRPLAYNALFPTAWVSAYFQNLTVLGDGRPHETGSVSARAWAQARLWPMQNHLLLSILGFFLFAVWVNVGLLFGLIPVLLKAFMGVETMATRSAGAFYSTTFFAAVTAVAFLLVDPIWRAAYAVRCFHGTSIHSGADLRASLRSLRSRAAAMAILLVLGLATVAPAAMQVAPTPVARVDAEQLDHSIGQTLERREFAWRFRRIDAPAATKEGPIEAWWKSVERWVARQWKALKHKIEIIVNWIVERLFKTKAREQPESGHFEIPSLDSILYGSLAIVIVLLAWAGWRYWRQPKRKVLVAEAVAPMPDLNTEDVMADQLPEDGWMKLARELMSRGELRLALRAAYLAGLAHLGQQQVISIARHKSNLDYQRELRRRARTRGELLAAFDENLVAFERAWYGDHGVTLPIFEQFTHNLERIRAC